MLAPLLVVLKLILFAMAEITSMQGQCGVINENVMMKQWKPGHCMIHNDTHSWLAHTDIQTDRWDPFIVSTDDAKRHWGDVHLLLLLIRMQNIVFLAIIIECFPYQHKHKNVLFKKKGVLYHLYRIEFILYNLDNNHTIEGWLSFERVLYFHALNFRWVWATSIFSPK